MPSTFEPQSLAIPAFLDYAPVPLVFGTSGLRGLVKDITDLEAYINVKGALRYLQTVADLPQHGGVVLAGDLRPSTERIMRACLRAILDAGCTVENAGYIPTPALIARAVSTGCAGVMVSGSHIPFDRNGIKLSKRSGEVLKSDEAGIIREVARVRAQEYGQSRRESAFGADGMLKESPALPRTAAGAEEAYVARYVDGFAGSCLAGWRVLVYQHSAVGRDLLARILTRLGAEVTTAGRSDAFVPIDTENITCEQLDILEEFARAAEADGRPLDAIVSTDGDSDRPLVTAVTPGLGGNSGSRRVRFLPGDLLGIVVAEYLKVDGVAVPISANDAVERRMKECGALLEKTKIGSPYVISALDRLTATGECRRVVGWEANGGFLTASDIVLGAHTIAALPTRDAVLPILANLCAAVEQKLSLTALWDRLPARFGRAGLLDDFAPEASRAMIARLIPAGEVSEVEFNDNSEVLDRSNPVGRAVPLTAAAAREWQRCRATLRRFFTPADGFDEIVRINVLDGVRVYFGNGDIAHVRQSGNAPQLRIYANSDSQARADQIVELALRPPDGILRRMEHGLA